MNTPSHEELVEQLRGGPARHRTASGGDRRTPVRAVPNLEQRLGRNPRNSSMPPSAEGFSKPPAPNRARRAGETSPWQAARRRGQPSRPGGTSRRDRSSTLPRRAPVAGPTSLVPRSSRQSDARSSTCRRSGPLPGRAPHRTSPVRVRAVSKAAPPRKPPLPRPTARGCVAVCRLSRRPSAPALRPDGAALLRRLRHRGVCRGARRDGRRSRKRSRRLHRRCARTAEGRPSGATSTKTGGRVAGTLHWVHVASNVFLTLIDCHQRRGRDRDGRAPA